MGFTFKSRLVKISFISYRRFLENVNLKLESDKQGSYVCAHAEPVLGLFFLSMNYMLHGDAGSLETHRSSLPFGAKQTRGHSSKTIFSKNSSRGESQACEIFLTLKPNPNDATRAQLSRLKLAWLLESRNST